MSGLGGSTTKKRLSHGWAVPGGRRPLSRCDAACQDWVAQPLRSDCLAAGLGPEVVVQATPYGRRAAVPAIALRARPFARLRVDACPSERYMEARAR